MNRRTFLKAGLFGSVLATQPVSAEHLNAQPSHVDRTFDEDKLTRYRPLLVTKHLESQPNGIFGQWTTSAEHDTDVGVYFVEHPFQSGITRLDSHFGDHEPIYVFVGSDDGEVKKVLYTGYHWLKAKDSDPNLFTDQPKYEIVQRWHHYKKTATDGVDLDLNDLVSVYDNWLENGLEDDIAVGSVVNPWIMEGRNSWWQDNAFGFSVDDFVRSIWLRIGIRGAEESDL